MLYQGELIRRERLRRGWNQKGLCRGICAVSYLSKIEKGQAEPSGEILRLLLDRLGLHTDPALETEAQALTERAYELLFCGRTEEMMQLVTEDAVCLYRSTASGLDLLLLRAEEPQDPALENCMNARQLALQRILEKRYPEATSLLPNAFCYSLAGEAAYTEGRYASAMELLQTGYDLAARDGAPRLMLFCRTLMGNCCANRQDFESMQRHYTPAIRLAEALGDTETAKDIRYNIAATQIELGRYEEAYRYFSSLKDPGAQALHKLAVCCEKTGRKEEALQALNRISLLPSGQAEAETMRKLCAPVRYRLEHPGYLTEEAYGLLLTECFEECRGKLPAGYAIFHLPWMLEWLKASRQYKKALSLLTEFPEFHNLS